MAHQLTGRATTGGWRSQIVIVVALAAVLVASLAWARTGAADLRPGGSSVGTRPSSAHPPLKAVAFDRKTLTRLLIGRPVG